MSIVRASFFMAFLRSCPVRDVFAGKTKKPPGFPRRLRVHPSWVEKAA
jgi:hypothetical protein